MKQHILALENRYSNKLTHKTDEKLVGPSTE